jgi:hypothetical protein
LLSYTFRVHPLYHHHQTSKTTQLLTSNLSAERKKMALAGVNIPRALALVEDGRSIRYAANDIEAPLTTWLPLVSELLEGFKRLVSTQEDLDLVEKEQPHTATID